MMFTRPDALAICCTSPNKRGYFYFDDVREGHPVPDRAFTKSLPDLMRGSRPNRKKKKLRGRTK